MYQNNLSVIKVAPEWAKDPFVFSKKEVRNQRAHGKYCLARVRKKGKVVRKANKIAYAEQLNAQIE